MKLSGELMNKLNLLKSDPYLADMLLRNVSLQEDIELKSIILTMLSNKNEGSSCVILDSDHFNLKIKMIYPDFSLKGFIDNCAKGRYKDIIAEHASDCKPLYLLNNSGHYLMYFQKYLQSESILKSQINALLIKDRGTFARILPYNTDKIKKIADDPYFSRLSAMQKLALILSLLNNFFIISGGPGSGKTTLIVSVIKALIDYGYSSSEIAAAAPTGKAGNILKESLSAAFHDEAGRYGIDISTIHRLLNYAPSLNKFSYNKNNRLPYKVIIIDEVSMVDLVLMSNLLEAVKDDCRLILVGDKDQLPSVDVGSILSDFMPDYSEGYFSEIQKTFLKKYFNIDITGASKDDQLSGKIVILEGNKRSKNKKIRIISELVKSQDRSMTDHFYKTAVKKGNKFYLNDQPGQIIPSADKKHQINQILNLWLKDFYLNNFSEKKTLIDLIKDAGSLSFNDKKIYPLLDRIFACLKYSKILTLVKDGYCGSNYANETVYRYYLTNFVNARSDEMPAGLPLMITANDYGNELFNGDTGIMLEDLNHVKKVFFKNINSYKSLSFGDLNGCGISFAMTVHKSQGSGYDNVLLIMPDNTDNRLLTKEILYTGITRAIENLMIYGSDEILKKTVSAKIIRQSGFRRFYV